ncbi:MAG: hypothetical protein FJZ13_06240 [Candidatus Omnitrophica bacterium]|nr:hypothetical protein [Candidatus Omnitrophota bacterium]
MRIINTISRYCFIFLLVFFIYGCVQKNELGLARECAARSAVYYQHSEQRYKKLIARGDNLDQLRFELGRLYYEHGELEKARQELTKSNLVPAVKLLAVVKQRLGEAAAQDNF